jgi:hypothetical protein
MPLLMTLTWVLLLPIILSQKMHFSTTVEKHTASVISNLQTLSQKWERLLFTTGGAINLSKSFWILMDWQWKGGVACLSTLETSSHSLLLTEGYNFNNPISVPQLSPFIGYHTLGVYISPSGSSSPYAEVLKEKSVDYASQITGCSLSREEALMGSPSQSCPSRKNNAKRFSLQPLWLFSQNSI